VRAGTLGAAALSRHAQSQPGLLAALPPAFAPVLRQLLDRLESSALFTDESCSFSQHDLLTTCSTGSTRPASAWADGPPSGRATGGIATCVAPVCCC
jgi:hypothetical protein